MVPQRFWGHDVGYFGSRDVIIYVRIGLKVYGFSQVVNLWSRMVAERFSLKHFRVTSLPLGVM